MHVLAVLYHTETHEQTNEKLSVVRILLCIFYSTVVPYMDLDITLKNLQTVR